MSHAFERSCISEHHMHACAYESKGGLEIRIVRPAPWPLMRRAQLHTNKRAEHSIW